jgi:uncharacterized protein (DUF427 family)
MTKITIVNNENQEKIAQGILGQDVLKVEGNYYFKADLVDFSNTVMEEDAYFCPIKQSKCDYYFLVDSKGLKQDREMCWIYEQINNTLFKNIQEMVGFYSRNIAGNGISILEDEVL